MADRSAADNNIIIKRKQAFEQEAIKYPFFPLTTTMKAFSSLLLLLCTSTFLVESFTVPSRHLLTTTTTTRMSSEDFLQETPEITQERIQGLVEENPVLLFMKGSKLFPQCGFSNTAVQILQSFGIDFQTVGRWQSVSVRGCKLYSPLFLYSVLSFFLFPSLIIFQYQTSCPIKTSEKESKSTVNGRPSLNCTWQENS